MNPYTGEVASLEAIRHQLIDQGHSPDDAVRLDGPEDQIMSISAAVMAERRRAAKAARKSRKRNRS